MEVNSLNNTNKVNNVASASSVSHNAPHSSTTRSSNQNNTVEESVPVSEPAREVNVTTGEQTGNGMRPHVKEAFNEEVEKQLKEMIDEINSRMQSHTEISYSIHERSSKLSIKIIDKESKKVVKEWPSEKSLDLLAKVFEQQAMMLDKRL